MIIKYLGWSTRNKCRMGHDWRVREYENDQAKIFDAYEEFPNGIQCLKCGWNISYCEPHWETRTTDWHGRLQDRATANLYHIGCYKPSNRKENLLVTASVDRSYDNDENREYIKELKNPHGG